MAKKIPVGLVGTGRIGRLHARTLKQLVPEADLQVVTDVNLQSARDLSLALAKNGPAIERDVHPREELAA